MRTLRLAILLCAALAQAVACNVHAEVSDVPSGTPAVSIDLATSEGAQLVGGVWRYSDTRIVDVPFRAPGKDGQPTGEPVQSYDILPHGGARELDDSTWEIVAPMHLTDRRGRGKVSFNWYRVRLTVPDRIGAVSTKGTTVVFETQLDDYAEVWVDGELARAAGQSGGSVVRGWNADNRLIVGRNVQPGQQIQLAIFGINGPISAAPTNFIYVRKARLDFYPGGHAPVAVVAQEVNVEVERDDPALDAIVPANPKVFKLADGFSFTEGPVWTGDHLLFSEPNDNRIYAFYEREGVPGELKVVREHSGYAGADIAEYGQPGSNGLAIDAQGRLTIDEHGNHRVSRLEKDGTLTVLVDNYGGKRLNSPNDLVYSPLLEGSSKGGRLYFTDPPFGLPKFYDDPRKELPFSGVYRLENGKAVLLTTALKGPNGLAFSPDGKFFYVTNWDTKAKTVTRFPVQPNGDLGPGELFFDMTSAPGEEALDGLKIDRDGNLYVSGPGGLWILDSKGKHLGTIKLPRLAANFAWGGPDGKTLYLTARSALYRMTLKVPGSNFSVAKH